MPTLEVVCPDGVKAGDTIYLQYGDDEIELVVPEGISPGDEFEVNLHAGDDEEEPEPELEPQLQPELLVIPGSNAIRKHYKTFPKRAERSKTKSKVVGLNYSTAKSEE